MSCTLVFVLIRIRKHRWVDIAQEKHIAMCNRVGMEGEMDFSGESIIVDANGNTVLKADDRERILYADIDLAQSCEVGGRKLRDRSLWACGE